MALPRGEQSQNLERPIATARWATETEVEQYRFQDGDIFLGYINVHPQEALPVLDDLDAVEARIRQTYAAPEHFNFVSDQVNKIASLRASLRTERFPIGYSDDRHLVTDAGSRSGKGVSALIPNLCIYPGSCVVVDPKAELAKITAARRGKGSKHCEGMGQQVHVLHPYNTGDIPEEYLAAFNPLDLLRDDDPDLLDNAASIADALVVKADSKDAHWDESAKELIKAMSLFVALSDTEENKRHLPRVLELLRFGAKGRYETEDMEDGEMPDYMRSLFDEMSNFDGADGVIAGVATTMLSVSDNEFGSILSTARRNLTFLEKWQMKDVLSSTSFDIDDLKTNPDGMTLYLCLPPTRMSDCSRWLRLMIATIMERMYKIRLQTGEGQLAASDETATGHPVLFVLEEFPVLGHMQLIETAAGFAAGYGIKLWMIIQDLTQMKRHYKDGWETFIGNAGLMQGFGISDNTTLEYFSKKLGECQTIQTTSSRTEASSKTTNQPSEFMKTRALTGQGGRGVFGKTLDVATGMEDQATQSESSTITYADSPQIQHSPLMRPDEFERVFRREVGTQCIMIKGEQPIACMRETYYDSPEFLGLFDPDRAPYRSKEDAQQKADQLRSERVETIAQIQDDALAYLKEMSAALDQSGEI